MNLKCKINLMFRKNKVIKINVFMPDRRYKTYVRELNNSTITLDNCEYVVRHDLIYFENGVATLNYLYDNPEAFNMNTGNIEGTLSASQINTILDNKIFDNLIREMKNKDQKVINTILLVGGVLLLAILGGLYFVYDQVLMLDEYIRSNQPLWDSLRDLLLNGGIN